LDVVAVILRCALLRASKDDKLGACGHPSRRRAKLRGSSGWRRYARI